MTCLLDTHTLLWWLCDDPNLSFVARETIACEQNEILVSPVTGYELSFKNRLGKLPLPPNYFESLTTLILKNGFRIVPINFSDTLLAGRLTSPHRDPFDRLLAAQAITQRATLITTDPAFATFPGLSTLW